jgi:uridine phosphorylase
MAEHETIPLLNHALGSASAFTPEALVSAVRTERELPLASVPAVCVLDFDGDLTDWLVDTGAAPPCASWACFHTSMVSVDVDGTPCGVIARTIGGPYAVLVAEQLAVCGARVVLGLTSAGRVSASLPVPSLVVATRAIRDEGTSYHYLPPGEEAAAPPGVAEVIAAELASLGLPVFQGPVWTTDAPYRETHEQLIRHACSGALAVEMQAASLFAFGAARRVTVGVVAHVTNAIDHSGEPFDKGPHSEGYALFQAICRAGTRLIGTPAPRL